MSELAPGILLATPSLNRSFFERSLIVLASHDEDGAFGWVTNGPELIRLPELLENLEIHSNLAPQYREQSIIRGGPVSEEQVWLLFEETSDHVRVPHASEVCEGLWSSSSRRALEFIAEGGYVKSLLLVAGYSGWGPSQLEEEISEGSWLPIKPNRELIFEKDGDRAWNGGYSSIGTTPFAFSATAGGKA